MPRSPGMLALAMALPMAFSMAVSPFAISKAKAEDKDASAKPVHVAPRVIYQAGSCHNFGYKWPGFSFPMPVLWAPDQTVTAWICTHDFKLAPHDWP